MQMNTPAKTTINHIRRFANRIFNRVFPAPTLIQVEAPRVRRWWKYGGDYSPAFKAFILAGDFLLLALVVLITCGVPR